MIKNLSGMYETVEYENKRFVMLYDNDEIEAYPVHWHNAVEIIIPLHNGFSVTSGGTDYNLNEKEIIIIVCRLSLDEDISSSAITPLSAKFRLLML